MSARKEKPGPERSARAKRVRRVRLRSFIANEFEELDLGDDRLNERGRKILSDLYCSPGESYLAASETWTAAKGAYRFVENEAVTHENLLGPHTAKLVERCRDEKEILCIGDTSEIWIKKRPGTKGLGPLNYKGRRGFFVHPLWVVTRERLPLGIADVRFITRSDEDLGRHHGDYRDVPLDERESVKWSWSLEATWGLGRALGPQGPRLTAIFDREGDVFNVLATAVAEQDSYRLIVRAVQKRRRVDKEGAPRVWEDVAAQPADGRMTINVPAGQNRKARTTTLSLRWAKVTLKPPRVRAPDAPEAGPLEIYAIHVIEDDPPKKTDRIEWKLFTTIPVTSVDDARECIERYACRWSIEWLFRTMKSGCGAELRQFRSAEKLKKTIVQDMLVAFTMIYLSMIRRARPDQPCTRLFRDSEWRSLWTYLYEDELPERPPSMGEMIDLLASIGGHLGRKGDSPAGPKVLKRALSKLAVIDQMWLIANDS